MTIHETTTNRITNSDKTTLPEQSSSSPILIQDPLVNQIVEEGQQLVRLLVNELCLLHVNLTSNEKENSDERDA